MASFVYSLLLCFPLSHGQSSPVGCNTIELMDTVPSPKVILYKEDTGLRHSRKQLILANLSKLMNLPSLHEGNHKLYIRIWLWEDDGRYILDIGRDLPENNASVLSWTSKKVDTNEYIEIQKHWESLVPESGWGQFFQKVNYYRIRSLEGSASKKYSDHLTHSAYVQVEIEEAGHYRYYEYLEPSFYRLVDSGANSIYEFLRFFDRQMNLKVYNPPAAVFNPK
jgi:hypothetical protein